MPNEMRHKITTTATDDHEEIVKEKLKGFSKTLAGIQWLILILILLYSKLAPEVFEASQIILLSGIIVFAVYVIFFHYLWPRHTTKRWRLALETWIMIAFITFVLWHTGKIESPLFSLYFIVIITSTIALGEKTTLFEIALIFTCFLLLSFTPSAVTTLSLRQVSGPLVLLFTICCVAFLGTMLSRETELAQKKTRILSQTDYLTGLWNMRMFTSLLVNELSRSVRFKRNFSVMMLDVDNLKPVNDTYGHESGSNLIKLIGDTIKKTLRDYDIVGRFGGDEFMVLLPNTMPDQAMATAERIRKAVYSAELIVPDGSVSVSTSIGIALYPDHGAEAEELINKADRALYVSKNKGKNRSTVFS